MRSKKLAGAVSALFLAAFASACGGGGGGGTVAGNTTSGSSSSVTGNTGGNTGGNTVTSTSGASLSGTVAVGLAAAKVKVTVQSVDGQVVELGTTSASGQFNGSTLPEKFKVPALLSAPIEADGSLLRTIVTTLPGTNQTANVNPITQAIASQFLPAGATLAGVDVTDGGGSFAAKAKKFVQDALGPAVDYDAFAGKPYKAKTADDPQAGGMADALIDTLARLDSTRKPEDILASAADPKDPAVSKSLMNNPAFQARFAGELVAQGRPADAVKTLIQTEAASGADTTAIVANTDTYAKSFVDIYASASTELGGSGTQKQTALGSIVASAATMMAKIVDQKDVSGGATLANVVANSMALVKGPLIDIGKDSQNGANLGLVLAATGEQISSLINASTVDLTATGADTKTLGTQVKNFGGIVSAAVAQSLGSGKDKSQLDDKEKSIVAANIGKGVANTLTSFMGDLAIDQSVMTVAQKTNLSKAQNTAKNTAMALDSALVGMTANKDTDSMGKDVVNSMAVALVNQASEAFKKYDLTVDTGSFSGSAANVLTNMATLVVNNAAILASNAGSIKSDKQAALIGAMAGQLLDEVKDLDMTGTAPPPAAANVAKNLAQAVGSALMEKVGQSSTYLGSSLQMLAASAVATATTELKKTTVLTETISTDSMQTLQQKAATSVGSSKSNIETSFQQMEAQGISLGKVTDGLAAAGLSGVAMQGVLAQVGVVMGSGGDAVKGAAKDIAKTAATVAQSVLDKGGTMAQMTAAVAAPLSAIAETAKGQAGKDPGQALKSLKESASTLEQTNKVLASAQNVSLGDMIQSNNSIAAIVGSQLSGQGTAALMDVVQKNTVTGGALGLETIAGQLAQTDADILSKAIAKQEIINADVQSAASAALNSGDKASKPSIVVNGDHAVDIFSSVALDASGSNDPKGKPLSYSWTVLLSPEGSAATLLGADSATPVFTPTVVGDYTLLLTVNNGLESSSVAFDIKAKLTDSTTFVARMSNNYRLSADGLLAGGSGQSANFVQPIIRMNLAWSSGQIASPSYINGTGH